MSTNRIHVLTSVLNADWRVLSLIGVGLLLGIVLLMFARYLWRRHDPAWRAFLTSGLRVPQDTVNQLREQLARQAAQTTQQLRQLEGEKEVEHAKERKRLQRFEAAAEDRRVTVDNVGKSLQSIEQHYLQRNQQLESEKAKEVLRLATDTLLSDLMILIKPSQDIELPQFVCTSNRHANRTQEKPIKMPPRVNHR